MSRPRRKYTKEENLEIVNTVKSITTIKLFKLYLKVKTLLWGGKFWSSGYNVNMVGQYGNAHVIKKHVKSQGNTFIQIYRDQLTLF